MTEKIQKIVEMIENLTVVELNELIKALEEKFGVSASQMMATIPTQTQVASSEVKEESSDVNVVLVDAGANKINVIKILREINPNLALKDAKDIVDNPPQTIAQNVARAKGEEIKKKLEAVGAKVELK